MGAQAFLTAANRGALVSRRRPADVARRCVILSGVIADDSEVGGGLEYRLAINA